jgi:tetratricopeptide (TPR) repeat protein
MILEEKARLSHSRLWNLQRRYFDRAGIEAWRQSVVPHFITSNSYIANAYARVVLAFLKDWRYQSSIVNGQWSPTQGERLVILELGGGSGRFAFHFLQKFLPLRNLSLMKDVPFTYVLTDFSERTIGYWQAHPALRPLVEQGVLDFAHFDAEQTAVLELRHSGRTVGPGSLNQPLVALANYFFDSIPQDAFRVVDGRLYESLVSLSAPDPVADPDDPGLLGQLEVSYSHQPITATYYNDPELDAILQNYQERLPTTTFVLPAAGIHCIRRLQALTNGRFLLLTGDKGYIHEESLAGKGDPLLNRHGSFSMMVNYHAIALYTQGQNGRTLHTEYRHSHLNSCAFLWGGGREKLLELEPALPETEQAFAEAINQAGPDDFFSMKQAWEGPLQGKALADEGKDGPTAVTTPTLDQIVAFLRWSGWDNRVFWACFPALLEQVDSTTETLRLDLFTAVQAIWRNYYHLEETLDLPFHLGVLLFRLQYYREALALFQESLHLYGPDKSAYFNMAVCHHRLKEPDQAAHYASQTLQLDPAFTAARSLLQQVE